MGGLTPASIAHMLISRKVRGPLRLDKSVDKAFSGVLEQYATCMELGALGPDLPYYGNRLKGVTDIVFSRSDKPMGVDQWSYQLHSKDPNVFPLKMLEITWKETANEKKDWDEIDHKKFTFKSLDIFWGITDGGKLKLKWQYSLASFNKFLSRISHSGCIP